MKPDDINGRWRDVLLALGLDEKTLSGKNGPCPICGGKDRFRFTNHANAGLYYCSQCGPGDGITLLEKFHNWDFRETMREIERVAGNCRVEPTPKRDGTARLRKVWRGLVPASDNWDIRRYLKNRGLQPAPGLKAHPSLEYWDGKRVAGRYPAMVGVVLDAAGEGVTLHCTYIHQGRKAPVESPKKIFTCKAGKTLTGSAVRLYPAGETLGIAEGIETAMAAHRLFSVPVWSCLFNHGLERFEPPDGVKSVVVFGDNDKSAAGQASAYTAAHKLAVAGYLTSVELPPREGMDFNDVLLARREIA